MHHMKRTQRVNTFGFHQNKTSVIEHLPVLPLFLLLVEWQRRNYAPPWMIQSVEPKRSPPTKCFINGQLHNFLQTNPTTTFLESKGYILCSVVQQGVCNGWLLIAFLAIISHSAVQSSKQHKFTMLFCSWTPKQCLIQHCSFSNGDITFDDNY